MIKLGRVKIFQYGMRKHGLDSAETITLIIDQAETITLIIDHLRATRALEELMATYAPEGFRTVTPYLVVRGAERLLEFLAAAFGAETLDRNVRPDGSIGHAQVRIGDSLIELADGSPEWPALTAGLHIYVADTDATYRRALAAGGVSLYEPAEMPYGERSAGVKDPAGNQWYIATYHPKA